MSTEDEVYKICSVAEWTVAEERGVFEGSAVDHKDGFIHFSTGAQARETAAKHFAGQADLVLVAVSVSALGSALVFEPSRGGALFPHLYGVLPLDAALWVAPLPLENGAHVFPSQIPDAL